MHACVLIREQPLYRRESFVAGLRACGYETDSAIRPGPGHVLVIWNRYGRNDVLASRYERAGGKVIIAENGYLGRDWVGRHCYALARSYHNGGGWWPSELAHTPRSQSRWHRWGVDLEPWRTGGEEIVVFATRHIGPQGIAEPQGWSERTAAQLCQVTRRPVRIRQHPGEHACTPLAEDLRNAWACVTWGSGAAIKALLMGVPVFYGFPKWIGADAAKPLDFDVESRFTGNRLPMFEKLAWAMWFTDEIEAGEPFGRLLQ